MARKHCNTLNQLSELSLAQCIESVYWVESGRIIFASPVASRTSGYSADELIQRQIGDLFRTAEGELQLDDDQQLGSSTDAVTGVQLCRDGRRVPVILRSSWHTVDGQRLVCVIALEAAARPNPDVVELQKSMHSLRQSEARYRQIVDTSFDVLIVSEGGVIREVNNTFLKLSGYSAAEVVGMKLADLLAPDSVRRTLNTIQQGRTLVHEVVAQKKDGSPMHLEVVGRTIDEDGRKVRLSAIRDISGRKEFEQEIRDGRYRLTLAMQGGRLGTFEWVMAEGGGIVSDSFFRIFGYEPNSVPTTYKTFARLTHPADLTRLERKFGVAQLSHRAISQEARIFWPDGTMHWVEVRAQFTYDDDGRAVRLDGVMVDIDDKKSAQLRLERSQQDLAMALESGNLATYEWDVATAVLEQSAEAEHITGWTLRGQPVAFADWIHRIHPSDRRTLMRQIAVARHTQNTLVVEFRLRRPDGTFRWVEVRGRFSFDKQGRARRITGVVGNIDHRKQAEEALRLSRFAVDVAPEAMFTLRPDGSLVDVNQTACDRLGYTREKLLKLNVRDFSTLASESFASHVNGLRVEGRRVARTVHRRKNGSTFDVQISARMFSYEGHEYICATARDFSEVRSAEDKTRELDQQLAHMNRLSSMGEMASAIAHELNQPLYVISNLVTLLQHAGGINRETTDEGWQMLETIRSQAILAGDIVRRMRGFCLNKPPTRTYVDVSQIIAEAMSLLDPQIRHSSVQVDVEVEGETNAMVDKIQIQQVLINLIQNAIDAVQDMPPAKRQIRVTSRGMSDLQVRVQVSDSGTGIAADKIHRIFDPFVSTKGNGMGMGLAISRSIVEAHNGRLTLDLNTDGDLPTTFSVNLPSSEQIAVIR